MPKITATVVGDTQLLQRLEVLPSNFKQEIRKAVDLHALKVLARVKLKLSDDVLHVRTGRLRRSITQQVQEEGGAIMGTVGTNVSYAKFHELGFSGTQNVREHLRTIKSAFGRKIVGGSVTIPVRAHTRRVDYPAHSFLATAMQELEPEFAAEVDRAAKKALRG